MSGFLEEGLDFLSLVDLFLLRAISVCVLTQDRKINFLEHEH